MPPKKSKIIEKVNEIIYEESDEESEKKVEPKVEKKVRAKLSQSSNLVLDQREKKVKPLPTPQESEESEESEDEIEVPLEPVKKSKKEVLTETKLLAMMKKLQQEEAIREQYNNLERLRRRTGPSY